MVGACHSGSKTWNKFVHLCRTLGQSYFNAILSKCGYGSARKKKKGFLVFLRLCLVMEIKKQAEYFHVVLVFGGKLGDLFLFFF